MGHFTLIIFLLKIQSIIRLGQLALVSFLMGEGYGIFALDIVRISLFGILDPFFILDRLFLKS